MAAMFALSNLAVPPPRAMSHMDVSQVRRENMAAMFAFSNLAVPPPRAMSHMDVSQVR